MKKRFSDFNILTFLLFVSLLSGNAKANYIPVVIQYGGDIAAASKTNTESQRILNEINAKEKLQIQNNNSIILDRMMEDAIKYNAPVLKYGVPSREIIYPEKVEILKYAPPAMSLYAVPSHPPQIINPR